MTCNTGEIRALRAKLAMLWLDVTNTVDFTADLSKPPDPIKHSRAREAKTAHFAAMRQYEQLIHQSLDSLLDASDERDALLLQRGEQLILEFCLDLEEMMVTQKQLDHWPKRRGWKLATPPNTEERK
jgi:hypothetical protein